jgi:hypothetical protein
LVGERPGADGRIGHRRAGKAAFVVPGIGDGMAGIDEAGEI